MNLENLNEKSIGHECFPIWKCQHSTKVKIFSHDDKERMKAIRTSSSSFIKREDVRSYIFQHKGNKCYLCGGEASQIDHKIPVAAFAYNRELPIGVLNSYDNLYPICKHCNMSKTTCVN